MKLIEGNDFNWADKRIQIDLALREFLILFAGCQYSNSSERKTFYKNRGILFSENGDEALDLFASGEGILKKIIPSYHD